MILSPKPKSYTVADLLFNNKTSGSVLPGSRGLTVPGRFATCSCLAIQSVNSRFLT